MSRGNGPKKQMGRRVALLETMNCAEGGISEHGRVQMLGSVAHLQSQLWGGYWLHNGW